MKIPDLQITDECITVGRWVAFFTFLIGSSILALYYFYNHSGIIFLSLFFMVSAFFVNSYVFIKLLSRWFSDVQNRKPLGYTLLILLLNIPIAFLYIKIGLEIYSKSFLLH